MTQVKTIEPEAPNFSSSVTARTDVRAAPPSPKILEKGLVFITSP